MASLEEPQANHAVETVEDSHQGNGTGADQQNGTLQTSLGGKKQGVEETDVAPSARRLWFVRMPRPPETSAAAIKPLEQELEALRAQFNLITEALNVKKVERDSAREATRAARDAFTQCRAAYDERAAPLKKLQEQRQDAAASANKLKASFGDLLVKSEAELDSQLAALHYRIEHESITLNEEKKALATIKKLEQQRERVREYESSVSLFAESRAKRSEIQDVLKECEGELSALRQEMDMQRQILDKLREAERGIDREVEEIIGERRRAKELVDAAFQRLSSAKKAAREKNNTFYANRGFSRDVRKLVADGKVEDARAACMEQMDEATAQLAADAGLRAEYFALWEGQRKAPVTLPSVDELDGELPLPSKGVKGAKGRREVERVDPAKKAEAEIAALLERAKEGARRKAAAAAAAAAPAAAEQDAELASDAPAAAEPEPAAQREVVGLDAAAAAQVVGAPPASKPAKPPKAAAPVRPPVEPVVVPEENFELPDVIRLKEKVPSSDELKQLEREHNRQAQAEAERRKAKRAAEKERKRRRQEQLASEAVEAANRAAEAAAASAQVAADAAARLAAVNDEAAGGSDTASSDGGAPPASSAAPEQAAPAVAPAAEQRKKGKAAPLPVVKAMAPKPAARRPAGAKQPALLRQAKKAAKEYSMPLVAGLVALVVLVLVSLFWTARSVAPQ